MTEWQPQIHLGLKKGRPQTSLRSAPAGKLFRARQIKASGCRKATKVPRTSILMHSKIIKG